MSTKVGGIPEVLPNDMILLTNTNPQDIIKKLSVAISLINTKQIDSELFHKRVSEMYSWENVAERTEKVRNEGFNLICISFTFLTSYSLSLIGIL